MLANKLRQASPLAVILLAIAFPMMRTTLSAQNCINAVSTNLHFTPVGGFTGDADVHVVKNKGEGVLHATFNFSVGSTLGTNDLAKKLAMFPSEELEIWVLYGQSRTLQLKEKWPPPGRSPGGYGKSGGGGGMITHHFYDPDTNTLTAVVVKLYDEYRVFPLGKSISPQNQ